uniref:Uncharacterized protein n=1 Tax=Trichobilharzia regenti TaxID=157069 RepID=A0AA85K3X2_TRIRE
QYHTYHSAAVGKNIAIYFSQYTVANGVKLVDITMRCSARQKEMAKQNNSTTIEQRMDECREFIPDFLLTSNPLEYLSTSENTRCKV